MRRRPTASTVPVVAIWLPLPASAGWRGEGIVQTVEHMLENVPQQDTRLEFELVVSPAHASLVDREFRHHPRVRIRPLPLLTRRGRKRKFTAEQIKEGFVDPTLLHHLRAKAHAFRQSLPFLPRNDFFRYGVVLAFYVLLQRLGLLFRNRIFWFPSPLIPLTSMLRGARVCSFWDPFIFEYGAYHGVGHKLYPMFLRHISRADHIITPSVFNRDYLREVLDVPANKITLIANGSPDYSKYALTKSGPADDIGDQVLSRFGRREFSGPLYAVQEHYIEQALAKSVLMRLLAKRKADPTLKTLFISTQYRPHKGLDEFLEVARQLVQRDDRTFRYQFVFTAFLPESVKENFPELREQLHELTRLSNRDHALIYQLSDLVIHPSHVEGGSMPYPLFEAASVGVPCLVNRGRHLDEALTRHPGLSCAVFDVCNPPAAIAAIDEVLQNPHRQKQILSEVEGAWRSWEDAAADYCAVFDSLLPDS